MKLIRDHIPGMRRKETRPCGSNREYYELLAAKVVEEATEILADE